MGSSSNVILTAEGYARHTERADYLFCLGNSLRALGVHLLKGRLFAPDDHVGKIHVAVISEGLTTRLWPHQNPIGRHIKFGVDDPMNDQPWLTVVGVVADVKATLTSKSNPLIGVYDSGGLDEFDEHHRPSIREFTLAGKSTAATGRQNRSQSRCGPH